MINCFFSKIKLRSSGGEISVTEDIAGINLLLGFCKNLSMRLYAT